MKKVFALLLALVMVLSFCACSGTEDETGSDVIKVGMVCIGDENDQGYTYNFVRATETATAALEAKGIKVKWIFKWNLDEGDGVVTANEELVEEGCAIIFNNSYGQEPAMLEVAAKHKDVQFVGCTNEGSWKDDLDNTHNAFARIHEGRYIAGVAAGLKLQQMIDEGTIKAEEAVIGYVGAYSFAEVVSGYTAYYLGARSVCPSVTMEVQYVNSWGDPKEEANAAQALIDAGAKLISQHSDSTTPATTAAKNNVFHTGYNADMATVAPTASIISTRIDWTDYFVYAIEAVANGKSFAQDYSKGLKDGAVVLTDLNTAIAAPGTAEKLAEVEAGIKDGSIKVFDITKFTLLDGSSVSQAFAIDTNGDWAPDKGEAIINGEFAESYVSDGADTLMSAPYFALRIAGIHEINP